MDCEEIEELSGAYALGAVTEDERREVEQHFRTCDQHAEMAELLAVAAALAAAAPERAPPARLKSRLMEAIRAESAPVRAEARRGVVERLRPWFSGGRRGYALAASLAIVVLALAGWNIALQAGDGGGPTTTVFNLDNGSATGSVIYIPDQQLALMTVDGLPQLPADKTYQVWTVRESAANSVGFLNVTGGRWLAAVQADFALADTIAVTVEPAGGSRRPTTDPVLQAPL